MEYEYFNVIDAQLSGIEKSIKKAGIGAIADFQYCKWDDESKKLIVFFSSTLSVADELLLDGAIGGYLKINDYFCTCSNGDHFILTGDIKPVICPDSHPISSGNAILLNNGFVVTSKKSPNGILWAIIINDQGQVIAAKIVR